LSVPALCDRVGVTKGSFYHHFEALPEFISSFADQWQTWMVDKFDRLAVDPDPRRRLESAAGWAHQTLTDSERALRAWAACNPVIAAVMTVPYERCRAANWSTFVEVTEDHETGQVLGTGVLALLSGLLYRPRPALPEHVLHLLGHWYRAVGIDVEWVRVGGRERLRVLPWQRLPVIGAAAPAQPACVIPVRRTPVLAEPDSSRTRFFGTAAELLVEHGAHGLTVAAMAERLSVTKGSFRHHFATLPNFVEHMALAWEEAQIARLDVCVAERDPWRRAELLLADLLVAPAPFDQAWRAWAQSTPVVGAAVTRVDSHHEAALAAALAIITDSDHPALLAEMTLAVSFGLHAWRPPFGDGLVCRVATDWVYRVLGLDAEVRSESGMPVLALGRVRGGSSGP
jgi:AcrR family transcriptional regulator